MVAELRSHMPQGAAKNKNVVGILTSTCQKVKPTGRKAEWRSEWMWVYMCVCVCVWERDRQTDNDRGRQGGTERHGWRYLWKDLCEGSLSWEAIPQRMNDWEEWNMREGKNSRKVFYSVAHCCDLLTLDPTEPFQEAMLSTLEQRRSGKNWPKAPGSWWIKGCSMNFLKN